MPWPTPQSKKDHERERKGVFCNLQSEAASGPDASPHPLHVAEEHDDAEEGEAAGDICEGAGHGEVVQQVPESREVGVDAEVGSVQLDALAVDLDDRSSGQRIRVFSVFRVQFPSRSCFCSAKPNRSRLEKISVSSTWSMSECNV